jgi:uncharacterized protein YcbX
VYPLKGAAGYDLPEIELDAFGVPLDRRWMLVDGQGKFVSQRTHPRLALIRVKAGEGEVFVEAPGSHTLSLPYPGESVDWREVRVHGDRMQAVVLPGDSSRWFCEFFCESLTLVFLPDEVVREVDPDFAPGHRVSFADGYPLHLVSSSSLNDLNGQISKPVDMLRFRPNLVVDGGMPWEEDTWREISVGTTRLEMVKPCARCQVPAVDPATGIAGREPMRTLGRFRRFEGKVYFGQNVVFRQPGGLSVGDDVRIVRVGGARPPL